jgi:hypothetical protein
MERFYFHILAGDLGYIPDTDGAELADLSAAHSRAVRIMYQTMSSVDGPEDWRKWRVKITDTRGNSVITLLYRSCFAHSKQALRGQVV